MTGRNSSDSTQSGQKPARILLAPFTKCEGSSCPLVHAKKIIERGMRLGRVEPGVPFMCSEIRTPMQSRQEIADHWMILTEDGGLREATSTERRSHKGLTNRRSGHGAISDRYSRKEMALTSQSHAQEEAESKADEIDLEVISREIGGDGVTQVMFPGDDTLDSRLASQVAHQDPALQAQMARYAAQVRSAVEQQRHIADYQLLEIVGQGASGAVVKVLSQRDGEHYAMKFTWGSMIPGEVGEPDRLRVARAYHIMSLLTTRHACRVFEIMKLAKLGVVTVEQLLEGESLDKVLEREGALSLYETKKVALAVGQALEEAHMHGYVHRDIKPANIFRQTNGEYMLVDWGIARSDKDDRRDNRSLMPDELAAMSNVEGDATQDGEVIGSVAWMAPEQLDGGSITPATDIYQLGATLYQLISGRCLFMEVGLGNIMRAIKEKPPVRASIFLPPDKEHRAFSNLISQMVEKEPQRRPKSMIEVLERMAGAPQEVAVAPDRFWLLVGLLTALLVVMLMILLKLSA